MFISNVTFRHCCHCRPDECSPSKPTGLCTLHECEAMWEEVGPMV